ncbi:transmembrane protein 237 homolog [Venturia canescens]|uniref:transmembrane protein 237 homolog n=1 Tax=Venturia canescens TaxID=32260 RepID=UPI001C9BD847|nr:transmembrane protein 237 homolog [Venturia canescens]
MSGERNSRVRRRSRADNEISDSTTTNKERDSECSSEKEASSDQPKSPVILLNKERTTSSSSVKSSRQQSVKSKISDDSSENVEEKKSTYSKYESSSNNNKKIEIIDSVRKVENFLQSAKMMKDNRESGTPDYNESSIQDKRRKSRKKRREQKRVDMDSNRTEDDAYDEEVRSSEREVTRSRTKKSRPNIPRKNRRKRRRSRGDSSLKPEKDEELPITEILRKAQENPKPRYEEPLPLTELTTDRIYVQGRNGFSAFKIPNDRTNSIFRRSLPKEKSPPPFPIRVSIFTQRVWNYTGLVHQGLLAGMALMHLILVETFFRQSAEFLEDYSVVSEYYTNIFSYLITMCIISAFDRFDLAQLNIEHYREIYSEHSRSLLAVPLYIATFCLHQTSLLVDDNISLIGYHRNKTENENNSTNVITDEHLSTWQKVTVAKDSMAVLAWLFVVLGPREDMLLAHLKSMEKYIEMTKNSA